MGEIAAGPGAPAEPAPPETTLPEDDPYAGMTEEERLEAEILGKLPERAPAPRGGGGTKTKRAPAPQPSSGGESLLETFLNSTTVESLGKEILRGVFGNRRRRR